MGWRDLKYPQGTLLHLGEIRVCQGFHHDLRHLLLALANPVAGKIPAAEHDPQCSEACQRP
jgi:hypothetical protein